MRMLTDRREALTRRRVQTVCRLHALLSELLPGQAKKDLTSGQAKVMLASVRPRDIAGKTRRRIAAEELADLIAIEAKMKKATAELKAMVRARQSRLMDIHGVGPVVPPGFLPTPVTWPRFADRNRFASWTGTAPLDASSGEQNRHRLSRAGNRRVNHMIHIAAVTHLRLDTDGRAPTTAASEPPGRSRPRHCAASSAAYPMPSTSNSSQTPSALERVREGTAGRLKNPARSTLPPHIDTSDQPLRTRTPDATPAPAPPRKKGDTMAMSGGLARSARRASMSASVRSTCGEVRARTCSGTPAWCSSAIQASIARR